MKQQPYQTHDGFFNTFTKKTINLHAPDVTTIEMEDIAHGLSNICRFGGQTAEFYSVAQHSVLVWHLIGMGIDKDSIYLKKLALLHDASEAYLGDVVKPLKNILGNAYTNIEYKFMQSICYKFDVDYGDMDRIKQFDKLALVLEHNYFFKGEEKPFADYFNSHENTCWAPTDAKTMYLWHFKETFEI